MENKRARKHVELDEYHNHKYVPQELRDSKNILSRKKSISFHYHSNQIHTETVAAISAPTPPVIGAS
jgi:hypothetical protein